MLEWSLEYKEHPVAIREPFGITTPAKRPVVTDYSELNRYELVKKGRDVAIIAAGNFFALGEATCEMLKAKNMGATLINPRFISGIDTELMEKLKADHRIVVTLEDGALSGGFGEKIARYFGNSDMKVLCYGARKEFVDRYNLADFLASNRLREDLITEDILSLCK